MSRALNPRVALFDVYLTLIDIESAEHDPQVWRTLARFARYEGLRAEAARWHDRYHELMSRQRAAIPSPHPEFDGVALFESLLDEAGHPSPSERACAFFRLFRVLTIRRFALFPETKPVLDALHGALRLGIISDAQRAFLLPELEEAGIARYFEHVVISSDFGLRKPEARLFEHALDLFGARPDEAVYIGDHPMRDVGGARGVGIPAIWLNRRRRPAPDGVEPTRILDSLRPLPELLVGGESRSGA